MKSSSIRSEIYLGFNYIPTPDDKELFFYDNYVIVPKEKQKNIWNDTSIKFIIVALGDINNAVIDLKFYGNRPVEGYKKKDRFVSIDYNMFRDLKLSMPDRLNHILYKNRRSRKNS